MNVTDFVDDLFAAYTPNPELDDFKAEVLVNLRERVADLEAQGHSPAAALARAQDELGDIREIAEQMSQARARDIYAEAYLHHKVRPGTEHLLGYLGCGALIIAGVALSLIAALSSTPNTAVFAWASVGLVALPIGVLVALGLTQETRTNLPMRTGRACGFGAAVFAILAGLALAGALLLDSLDRWGGALAAGLPLVVAGAGLAVFLGVTQTNRKKPWARHQAAEWARQLGTESPSGAQGTRWARFGLYLVALWLMALAVFFVLGFTIGFQFAWITFLVAFAAQFVLVAWAMKPESSRSAPSA